MTTGYAPVNGLRMYYEVAGAGDPVVYIAPALASAGFASFGTLARHRTIITLDLQGHGRTADLRDRPLSLEQHARDVLALLDHLGVAKTDVIGDSFGGGIATLLAVHHRERVRRVVSLGATFGPPAVAHNVAMLRFDEPPTPQSLAFRFLRERYEQVAPDPSYWPTLWTKVAAIQWNGFTRDELAAITTPMLIVVGDRDFVRIDHAVDTFRLIPNAELAVMPDAGHFMFTSEPERLLPMIEHFLTKPAERPPVGSATTGYQPGVTR